MFRVVIRMLPFLFVSLTFSSDTDEGLTQFQISQAIQVMCVATSVNAELFDLDLLSMYRDEIQKDGFGSSGNPTLDMIMPDSPYLEPPINEFRPNASMRHLRGQGSVSPDDVYKATRWSYYGIPLIGAFRPHDILIVETNRFYDRWIINFSRIQTNFLFADNYRFEFYIRDNIVIPFRLTIFFENGAIIYTCQQTEQGRFMASYYDPRWEMSIRLSSFNKKENPSDQEQADLEPENSE